jgi:hypothetical protein
MPGILGRVAGKRELPEEEGGDSNSGPFAPAEESEVPVPTAPPATIPPQGGFAPETQVGPANIPTGVIETQVNEQVAALEQRLTEAMQP